MESIKRTITHSHERDFYQITAELRINHPILSDGFSITGQVWEGRSNAGGMSRHFRGIQPDFSGATHGRILAVQPLLAPLVLVHLCDPDGVPMHALANGWYFHRNGDHAQSARALHILPDELPRAMGEAEFEKFANGLRPRWRERAEAAYTILTMMSETDS